jgi:H+-translocating diphosphatase
MFVVTLVFISGIAGIIWAAYNYYKLGEIEAKEQSVRSVEEGNKLLLDKYDPVAIGAIIQEGANAFIYAEYKIITMFMIVMGGIIYCCVDNMEGWSTTITFLVGALTSMFCGAFGMRVATFANYRTTLEAQHSLGRAFKCAFRAGCVMGFTLVSVSVMVLMIIILLYKSAYGLQDVTTEVHYFEEMFEAIAGYGLGGSTIALFARVGGGIYTKAADLGSDLVGKVESNLPEDSPKNPATIADNVGDNVGDVAGMSADLFGSFAESTCAALVIGSNSLETMAGKTDIDQITYVLGIPAIGILGCIAISYLIAEGKEIEHAVEVEGELKKQLIWSTAVLLPCLYIIAKSAFPHPFRYISNDQAVHDRDAGDVFGCCAFGLVAGLAIGYVTEVMTSYSYVHVQQLANVCKTGTATNIIYGLALGYLSTIIPIVVLCAVVYYSHSTLGYLGVALAALGMLSNLPICLAIDGYGPIADNAGGIAEMSELDPEVRERTDVLDSAGNTTAAVGKGFAIGSATLVGFALYGAFMHTCFTIGTLKQGELSFDDPLIFTSLLFGAMIPYAFSALTMKSVGLAAHGMIDEVRRQIRERPGIIDGTERPDYKRCI